VADVKAYFVSGSHDIGVTTILQKGGKLHRRTCSCLDAECCPDIMLARPTAIF
jgi:hypothetical protein